MDRKLWETLIFQSNIVNNIWLEELCIKDVIINRWKYWINRYANKINLPLLKSHNYFNSSLFFLLSNGMLNRYIYNLSAKTVPISWLFFQIGMVPSVVTGHCSQYHTRYFIVTFTGKTGVFFQTALSFLYHILHIRHIK